MKKIYFLIIFCCLNLGAFGQKYYPSTATQPYGGTAQTVCLSANNTATTVTYSVCATSVTGTPLIVTPIWYLNNTAIYTGASFSATPGGGTITLPANSFAYSTQGIFTGANGLKCILTWTGASPTPCGAGSAVTGNPTNVTVSAPPTAITGTKSVCAAATTQLSDGAVGGTWTSGTSSVATVGSTTGLVTGAALGTTVITYNTACGTATTTTVTVTPIPTAISGPIPSRLCSTLTVTLSDAVAGGTWSSSSTSLATVGSASGVVTGGSSGTVVVTYSNGCGTAPTTTITVNPLPAPISGYKAACMTLTTTLSDATAGGIWTSTTTTVAVIGSTSGFVNGISPGTSRITYSLPTGCIATTTLTVTPAPPPAPITGANVVCVGQNITLSQATGVGYWTSDSTTLATIDSTTGILTGMQTGIDTIKYTIGTGCVTTHTVTIHPLGPITGADSLCFGGSTFLADIVGGGTWSSVTTTVATINPTNGFVNAVAPGTSKITYTTTLGCIATVTMTVIAYPPAITGTTHTCPGASVILSDATLSGVWSSGNNGVATVNPSNGTVYGVFADTVDITYTLRPGCSAYTRVLVNPLPSPIIGINGICATLVDSLADTTANGVWSTTTGTLTTINSVSGVFTALNGGNAVFVYTLPATGCKITKTVVIHPLPVPIITYNNVTATLYTGTGYSSYQWYDDFQGLIPGATSPSLAALYTENYHVVVTDSFGCVGTSALYYFDATLLGIKNVAAELIKVYPNPAKSVVYIDAPAKVRVVIAGIDGKTLIEQEDAKQVDISRLADGMYFITLYNDDKQAITVRKIIKQ